MSDATNKVQRYQSAVNQHLQVMFLQIVVAAARKLSHRDKSAFDAESIESVSTSLVQEGPSTPLVVYATGDFITDDGEKLPLYGLVSGHRRRAGIAKAIDDNIDVENFHRRMLVPVVLMAPGEGQSEESFSQDVLARSVLENEQRTKLNQLERLRVVARFEKIKMPKPRAASALAISLTQYDRDARIVKLPWLYQAVKSLQIGASDAAKLAEAAEKKGRIDQFRNEFSIWVAQRNVQLEKERVEQRKLGRELKGASLTLKKYLTPSIVKTWEKALNAGTSLIDTAGEFNFGVVVDAEKKTVDISRVSASYDDLTSADVAVIIAEMASGARKLVPVMRALQLREQAMDVSPEEVDAELTRIQEEARAAAELKAVEDAGREPEMADAVAAATPENIGVEIDEQIDAALEGADEEDSNDEPRS